MGKRFQEFILENWSRFLDDCQTPLDKNTIYIYIYIHRYVYIYIYIYI